MLTIFAPTEQWPALKALVAREDRLDELIDWVDVHNPAAKITFPGILLREGQLSLPLCWNHQMPPYLLPDLPLSDGHFLGLIFHLLENDQKAWAYLHESPYYPEFETQNSLKYSIPFAALPTTGEDFRGLHNQAVILHYGYFQQAMGQYDVPEVYRAAVAAAPDTRLEAFCLREWATFYQDMGYEKEGMTLLQTALDRTEDQEAHFALKLVMARLQLEQLVAPYKAGQLEALKSLLWEVLSYYEATGDSLQVGLLLLDATQVTIISESYAEGLGYVKRALAIFDQEGLSELAAQGHMLQGTLLATWAQQGSPQFYKPAIESYQRALYAFTKNTHPAVFADIQHKLGVLYAEMPAENKKRSIWAGVSSASFHEALAYFTKESHPYEYASICNNFANAYTKFPPAIHSDNHIKALGYYEEALEIRTSAYPYERAITLLNYLEASWDAGNDPESFNHARYDDMMAKAREVAALVSAPDMLEVAAVHLENLEKLKALLDKSPADA